MKYLLTTIALAACGTPKANPVDPNLDAAIDATPDPDANPACTDGAMTNVSGVLTSNATWSGTVRITANTTINTGVTITVSPGTTILVPDGVGVVVKGTPSSVPPLAGALQINGTSACKVTVRPETAGSFWEGFIINGGTMTASYLVQTGGGIHLGLGTVTLRDSALSRTAGDFLTMKGGTLDVAYSSMGLEPGVPDSTHCNMHFAGTAGNIVKVTHSNVSTASYGLMFYNGQNADFTYNNWFSNSIDIDTNVATPVTGDVSFGWFAKGAPTNPPLAKNNLATARLVDAGPRP